MHLIMESRQLRSSSLSMEMLAGSTNMADIYPVTA